MASHAAGGRLASGRPAGTSQRNRRQFERAESFERVVRKRESCGFALSAAAVVVWARLELGVETFKLVITC